VLKIRAEQMEVFKEAARRAFEERATAHLERCFPERCTELGEEGVRASIRDAVERSQRLGLVFEYDIERYLNHMYALGFDFDSNPAYPWVQELLSDTSLEPAVLMDVLSERTQQELDAREAETEGL
jgi:hypothetical protein